MPSLTRFKQRLRGEVVEQPQLDDWLKSVTEISIVDVNFEDTPPIEEIEETVENEMHEAEEEVKDAETVALESMTKEELDRYAEEHGIHLDRRKSKMKMITEFIQKLKEKN